MDDDDQTACILCTAIKHLFHANKEPRAMFLVHEFHTIKQGYSSIFVYYQQMRYVAMPTMISAMTSLEAASCPEPPRRCQSHFTNTTDSIANSPVQPSSITLRVPVTCLSSRTCGLHMRSGLWLGRPSSPSMALPATPSWVGAARLPPALHRVDLVDVLMTPRRLVMAVAVLVDTRFGQMQ